MQCYVSTTQCTPRHGLKAGYEIPPDIENNIRTFTTIAYADPRYKEGYRDLAGNNDVQILYTVLF